MRVIWRNTEPRDLKRGAVISHTGHWTANDAHADEFRSVIEA